MKPLPKLNRKASDAKKATPVLAHPSTDAAVETPTQSGMDQATAAKPPRRTKTMLTATAIAALAVTGGIIYFNSGLNPAASVADARMTIGTADFRMFEENVPVNAIVIPERTVFIDTVEGGRVIERNVEDGTFVTAGTPLITLRNKSVELDVMNREAQYTQQLSSLAQAQIAFDQNILRYDRDLMDAKLQIDLVRADLNRRLPREETGVPQSEIDRLEAELAHQERSYELIAQAKARDTANAARNLDQLKQSVSRMEASITLVRDSLDGLTLRAPIDGEVSALTTEVGEVLAPGARLGQIDEIGAYKIRAQINEFYLGRLAIGQAAETTIGGIGHTLIVDKIYPTVENREFAADLKFDMELPEGLRRGQSLQLRVALSQSGEHLTIPTGAYFDETGGQYVYVLNADGSTATKREIVLGRRGSTQIEVVSGLTQGEEIITSSYSTFSGRDRVRIQSPSRS